jgi:hypothetical protein
VDLLGLGEAERGGLLDDTLQGDADLLGILAGDDDVGTLRFGLAFSIVCPSGVGAPVEGFGSAPLLLGLEAQ